MERFGDKKNRKNRQSPSMDERLKNELNMFSSNHQPIFHADSPDPLGSDYSPQDCDLDIKIGEQLRQAPVPEGLAERVCQASLSEWRTQSRMRVGPGRAAVAIKRLALAACVAIAVVAAFWVTSPGLESRNSDSYVVETQVFDIGQSYGVDIKPSLRGILSAIDSSGFVASHDLTWEETHDELLNILEAEQSSDAWGYLAVEIH